ncbi:MAG: hypothetical protein ACTHQQ_22230 [Solirubrobacteraceae bacterium]
MAARNFAPEQRTAARGPHEGKGAQMAWYFINLLFLAAVVVGGTAASFLGHRH